MREKIAEGYTLAPRPDYWGAVLWRKLMGSTVLDAGRSGSTKVPLYGQCLRGVSGGVALLAINTDASAAHMLDIPLNANRYTLTAKDVMDNKVDLNGSELRLTADGDVPAMAGSLTTSGQQNLPPVSITFFAIPEAKNPACVSGR